MQGPVKVVWNSSEEKSSDVVVTLDSEKIRLWNLEKGSKKLKSDQASETKSGTKRSKGTSDEKSERNHFLLRVSRILLHLATQRVIDIE